MIFIKEKVRIIGPVRQYQAIDKDKDNFSEFDTKHTFYFCLVLIYFFSFLTFILKVNFQEIFLIQ